MSTPADATTEAKVLAAEVFSAYSLPFEGLDDAHLAPLRSGPRISSVNPNPKSYYGPVTIRQFDIYPCLNNHIDIEPNMRIGNYITGCTKRTLRTSKTAKEAFQYGAVFLRLPIELQLCVRLRVCRHPVH